MDEPGNRVSFSFESGGLSADDVERLTADMWADLAFDREALANLKRDGLALEGINLGGHSPYRFEPGEADEIRVTTSGEHADILLDLWRIHFRRGLRPRNLAA